MQEKRITKTLQKQPDRDLNLDVRWLGDQQYYQSSSIDSIYILKQITSGNVIISCVKRDKPILLEFPILICSDTAIVELAIRQLAPKQCRRQTPP